MNVTGERRNLSNKLKQSKKVKEQQKKKQTRRILVAVCLIVIIFGSYAVWQYLSAPSENPPEIKPTTSLFSTYEFTMNDINGTQFTLNNYLGKVIVIHLMAVGCSGQINQINNYQLIRLKSLCSGYCDTKPVTVVSVAVATCETSNLAQLRETYGITWFFGNDVDDGIVDIAQNYGVYGDGTIILIDKDFQVHEAYSDVGLPALQSEINQLLEA